ncbi:MAG: RluA family pseudouridine synthase [Bacteroidota bacterium]|nr:RluA family pseudouridine synthase [Bacteroidota bacterium]
MDSISNLILFKDHHLLVCNKPSGLPSQPDDTKDKSLFELAEIYSKQKLYICNRIDRPVSGLILFAKHKEGAATIQAQFKSPDFSKTYLALVPISDLPQQGEFNHWHTVNKNSKKAKIDHSHSEGAIEVTLSYECVEKGDHYQLLMLHTPTGRFHQIRAQLAFEGLPIRGDVRYGARRANPDRSIGLHSWKLSFLHPANKEQLHMETPWPMHDIWPHFNKNVSHSPA